jgi:hypothetical protein
VASPRGNRNTPHGLARAISQRASKTVAIS